MTVALRKAKIEAELARLNETEAKGPAPTLVEVKRQSAHQRKWPGEGETNSPKGTKVAAKDMTKTPKGGELEKNGSEMRIVLEDLTYPGEEEASGESPRGVDQVSFSPVTQSPSSSQSSDLAGKNREVKRSKVRSGGKRVESPSENSCGDLGSTPRKKHISATPTKRETEESEGDLSENKRNRRTHSNQGGSEKTDHKYGESLMESGPEVPKVRRVSNRLPKAKVVIARKRSATVDADRRDSDEGGIGDGRLAHEVHRRSSVRGSEADDEIRKAQLSTVKTRKLVTEYDDPKELLVGHVSMVDLMSDAGSDQDGNRTQKAQSSSKPSEDTSFGTLADIVHVDDDSRLLSSSALIVKPGRAPAVDRKAFAINEERKGKSWTKRYDEYFDAEELNSKMELMMVQSDFNGSKTPIRPRSLPKKRRRFRLRKLFKSKSLQRPPVDSKSRAEQINSAVATRKNEYTSRAPWERRSSMVSGAIERVSLACDPFIEFMAGREPMQVRRVARRHSPLHWLRRKLFGPRTLTKRLAAS